MIKRTRDEKLRGAYFADANGYWVVIPFVPGWVAAQRLVPQRDTVVVAEVRIYPDETPPIVNGVREGREGVAGEWSHGTTAVPEGGVTTSLLRRLPVGGRSTAPVVADWLESVLFAKPDRGGIALEHPEATKEYARRVLRDLGGSPRVAPPNTCSGRRGRPPLREDFCEQIAAEYRELQRAGVADIGRRLAAKHRRQERATVRGWVRICRERGYLPAAAGPGRGSVIAVPVAAKARRRARPAGF